MKYEKCLVEVDEILNHLTDEDLIKIPEDIREAISKNKDKEYVWNYDETKELNSQNLDRGSIAILSYLNIEYMLDEEQRKLMKKIHKYNEEKKKTSQHYTSNFFEYNKESGIENEKKEIIEIKKQKWYEKIKTFLKKFFKR